MTRQTSIAAYNKIKSDGLLSKRRLEVYQILYKFGPLTAHEVVNIARSKYPKANQTGFNARLSELRTMTVVDEVGEKADKVSGHLNILWDVNSNLPIKLPKKKTKDKIIAELRLEIEDLKTQLMQLTKPLSVPRRRRSNER